MRRWLAMLPAVLLAATGQGAPTSYKDCRSIVGDAQRLACYDASVDAESAHPAPAAASPAPPPTAAAASTVTTATPAPPVAAAPAPVATAPTPEAGFGAETVRQRPDPKEEAERPKTLRASVVNGPKEELHSGMLLNLDNGQVWRYIDDKPLYFGRKPLNVEITRNVLGNYFIRVDDVNQTRRVRREQ